MDIKLASDEMVVKEWDYAIEKANNSAHVLLVTNKRVVAAHTTGKSFRHIEIAIGDIASVEMSCAKSNGSTLGIFFLFFGILMIIGALIHYIFAIVGALMIIVGILLMLLIKKTNLVVEIYYKSKMELVLSLAANSFSRKTRKRSKSVKVKVNREVAEDIINTLGAILLCK